MSLTPEQVAPIAHLARIAVPPEQLPEFSQDLSNILDLVEQMKSVDTNNVEPLAHPLETSQRLRADEVTETNAREKYQTVAPEVESGLYLVPKVID